MKLYSLVILNGYLGTSLPSSVKIGRCGCFSSESMTSEKSCYRRDMEPFVLKVFPLSAYSGEAGQRFHGKLDTESRASWTVGAKRRGVFGFYPGKVIGVKFPGLDVELSTAGRQAALPL